MIFAGGAPTAAPLDWTPLVRVRFALPLLLVLFAPRHAHAADPGPVQWNPAWPHFRLTEGAATVTFSLTSLLLDRALDPPREPRWTGGILFDDAFRNLARARDARTQQVYSQYSDKLYVVSMYFPYVDALLALAVHRNPEVSLQMALIDAEALSFASLVALLVKPLVARERPYVQECDPSSPASRCGTVMDRGSFISGHATMTFTSAALTCVHHKNIPLYGGGGADTWACIWGLSVATGASIFRVMSDNHYVSDVFAGAAVGLASGYLFPSALHYGFGKSLKPSPRTMTPLVLPFPGGAGVGMTGVF